MVSNHNGFEMISEPQPRTTGVVVWWGREGSPGDLKEIHTVHTINEIKDTADGQNAKSCY
jgi:hypothetical protein